MTFHRTFHQTKRQRGSMMGLDDFKLLAGSCLLIYRPLYTDLEEAAAFFGCAHDFFTGPSPVQTTERLLF